MLQLEWNGIKIIWNQLNDMFGCMDLRSFSTKKQKQDYIVKLTFKSGGHCEVADNYLDYSFRRRKPSEVKRSYLRKEKSVSYTHLTLPTTSRV